MATTPEKAKDVDVTREHVTWGRWKKRDFHGCLKAVQTLCGVHFPFHWVVGTTSFAPYCDLAEGAQRLAPPASVQAPTRLSRPCYSNVRHCFCVRWGTGRTPQIPTPSPLYISG